MATRNESREATIDIELVAQRILKLAEIATLEHLEAVARSQADGLMSMFDACGSDGFQDRLSA